MNVCTICNKEIKSSSFIGTCGGVAHSICYVRENPPKNRKTFQEVLVNCDDQVLVRELLNTHVSYDVKITIINNFNKAMKEHHERRLEA